MKKINKTVARKLFDAGKRIYIMPNKLALGNPWVTPSAIQKISDATFDSIVNAYCAYMPKQLGTYCAYYVNA